MKSLILSIALLFSSTLLIAQSEEALLMMESERDKTEKDFQVTNNDYADYLRSKAWNRTRRNSLLKDVNNIEINNIGGRVRSTVVDSDNGIFLAAPSGGGLWHFGRFGSSFEPVDDFGSFMRVSSLTQNPFNSSEILASTGDTYHGVSGTGIFRSTDKGKSFSLIDNTLPTRQLDIYYTNNITYHPERENEVYLCTYNQLYRSTDNSKTYEQVLKTSGKIFSIEFNASGEVLVTDSKVGIHKSKDGTAGSFAVIENAGLPDPNTDFYVIQNMVISSFAKDRDIIYALYANKYPSDRYPKGEVFKSTDGGASWTQQGEVGFWISSPTFALAFKVNPFNENFLIGGGVGQGYSEDGGKTWHNGGGLEVDYHSIVYDRSNPNNAYIGYDQGIGLYDLAQKKTYRVWNGSEYVNKEQPLQDEIGKRKGFNTSQVYYGDYYPAEYGDAVVFGQQDGGSFQTVENKNGRILIGDGGSIFVHRKDPNKILGSTQRGRLYSTDDGFNAWSRQYTRDDQFVNNHTNFITQFEMNRADSDQIYFHTIFDIQRSNDFGKTFTKIADLPPRQREVTIAVSEEQDPTVYTSGFSTDGGITAHLVKIENAATDPSVTNYTDFLNRETFKRISVDPNNPNIIFAVSRSGNVFEADVSNGDIVVKSIKGNLGNVFKIVIGVEGHDDILIAGTNIGLFYSMDRGTSWEYFDNIPFAQVLDLGLRKEDNRLFIFTHGRGAWAGTLDLELTDAQEEEFVDISIYPNPSSDIINIDYKQPFTATIYDVKGIKMIESSESSIKHNLPNGSYIIHITEGDTLIKTQKIVVTR